jgi:glutathione S-transferase
MRRVPVLVLDDGRVLPESDAIVEYLEDAYPQVPLRPEDAVDRARVRLIARVAELYVFPATVPIFAARAAGDTEQIAALLRGFWDGAQSEPTLSSVIREMAEAMAARQRSG